MAEGYRAEHLTYKVGQRTLINDVSLSLSSGELVALIGPNGAGKSTLLRLLTGYLKPTSGICLLADKPLGEWHPEQLSRRRAVMRQHTQLAAGNFAVRHCHTQHGRVALHIPAVLQAQGAEVVLAQLARLPAGELVAELRCALVHELAIECGVLVHLVVEALGLRE